MKSKFGPLNREMLANLILGMRSAFVRGENVMLYARNEIGASENETIPTLIAYDLQAGSYIEYAKANPELRMRWCQQVAEELKNYIKNGDVILEAGSGEATTLAGVRIQLKYLDFSPLGFDISWSRCAYANTWLAKNNVKAKVFVADLFEIPLASNSIDVVYTSHSLEPNGGKEKEAIRELLRISKRAVVLIEPLYELASAEAQERMRSHGYVSGLKEAAESLGAKVLDYRLLSFSLNSKNPSGVIVIQKVNSEVNNTHFWCCPLTGVALNEGEEVFHSNDVGVVYPVIANIPVLTSKHAIIASAYSKLVLNNGGDS